MENTEKLYRVEVKIKGRDYYGGFFRSLQSLRRKAIGKNHDSFLELMNFFDENLPLPYGNNLGLFWFTQKGWDKFKEDIKCVVDILNKNYNNYLEDVRVISTNITQKNKFTYCDIYQVAINARDIEDKTLTLHHNWWIRKEDKTIGEKLYRVETIVKRFRTYHGIFQGLQFEKIGISDGLYEELIGPFNDNLNIPSSFDGLREFWFTQEGWNTFKKDLSKLIKTINEKGHGYIKEYRVLVTDMHDVCDMISYKDEYQVALKQSIHKKDVPYEEIYPLSA